MCALGTRLNRIQARRVSLSIRTSTSESYQAPDRLIQGEKSQKMSCVCPDSRDCVLIDEKTENHIIERHFNPSENDKWEPKRAFFFEDVFSPGKVFARVIHELRNGLKPHKKSGDCYVYYLHFRCYTGYFPYQSHGPVTNIVKVVCSSVVCQHCFEDCPSRVVTIHPWMN